MAGHDPTTAARAEALAKLIALGRIGLGVAATFAPRLTGRVLLGDESGDGAVAVRMLGGRDGALGLGTLFAGRRRGPVAMRGWVEAGSVADLVDAVAFARGRGLDGPRRTFTVLVAGGAAVAGMVLARMLADGGESDQRSGPT